MNYDKHLPEFKTSGGVIKEDGAAPLRSRSACSLLVASAGKGGLTVTAPSAMFVAALDMVLDQLKSESKLDFGKVSAGTEACRACPDLHSMCQVVAVSGSGQQHGSVYWKKDAKLALQKLNPEQSLFAQLSDAFSLKSTRSLGSLSPWNSFFCRVL